jgi:glycosyltransferase involved in cell wall biosynthesis
VTITRSRVAIFTETFLPRVDGIVNTLKWTLSGLVEADWEPLVVAPSGNTQTLPGVAVIGAPSIAFPLYREVRLAYPATDVWRALDTFRPDIVHLAGPVTNGHGGLKYALARGVPVISSYHTALPNYACLYGLGWIEEWAWSMLRSIHNSTAATLCPSLETLCDLRARGFQRLELWSRGVDCRLFDPARRSVATRARLGAGPNELLVVYVGRLAREKKLERLATALRMVTGVHAALVGSGPECERLGQVFDGLPATFTGPLHGTELAEAYASADVFVFPSDTDTFGNVVLEAMASGLPVVASAVGGHLDLINDQRNGLLFPPESTSQLARHLERYRDDPRLRAKHAAEGRRLAELRTWPRQVQRLVEHYRRAIAERRAPPDKIGAGATPRVSGPVAARL